MIFEILSAHQAKLIVFCSICVTNPKNKCYLPKLSAKDTKETFETFTGESKYAQRN